MSPDLEHVIRLQRLDTEIGDATRRIAAYPERLEAADTRLHAAHDVWDAATERLKAAQERRRSLEKEAAVFQGRLAKFKDQQSAVKTNREYQALGHEIETAQHNLGAAEEKEIEIMVEADELAASVKAAGAALAAEQKRVDAEKRELAEELARTELALQEALRAREALVAQLDPQLLALFEQVARMRKGVGVGTAQDGLCSICHVRLRPHVYQQVRRNDSIIQCESCQRILYFVPPPVPPPAPVDAPAPPAP